MVAHFSLMRAGVFVEKVLLKKSVKDPQRKRKAVGVSALTTTTFGGRQFKLEIRAKIVVSSAGSLHTPALLLRSKITCKGNVGRNLHIHPATAVTGVFGKVSAATSAIQPPRQIPQGHLR